MTCGRVWLVWVQLRDTCAREPGKEASLVEQIKAKMGNLISVADGSIRVSGN